MRMKTTFNLTTSPGDLDRFPDTQALLKQLEGFDGVELMCLGEDRRRIIPPERVIGLHMSYFPAWLDFWNGDEAALIREYGSLEQCAAIYGGLGREALLRPFRADLANAKKYGAEYVVFHVSDACIDETFTGRYRHRDEEVIDAACEVLNALFAEEDGQTALLLENLWQPGLTMTRPDMTERLLSGVRYPNRGLMLDTGHLLHTDNTLRTQKDGLSYIHRKLAAHGSLCGHIRGVHLHQSLTGAYCARVMADPPPLEPGYSQRLGQMFEHAFAVDRHRPFTCPGVGALIRQLSPEYLTYEFITTDAAQHRAFLRRQRRALERE